MPTDHTATTAIPLLILGAGGHARVVADAALMAMEASQLLATDRNESLCTGELLPGVALKRLSDISPWPGAMHVAIGDNKSRESESRALGLDRLASVLHPACTVSSHAQLQTGCFVAAQAVVGPGAFLGQGVIINHGAVVDHDCEIGAFAHIAPGAVLGGGVIIGTRVLVGAGAVVQPGLSVVDSAIIGSGAVVCQNIETPGTYVGVPARRIP